MYKFLKGIRVTLSLVVIMGILAIFIDFTNLLPSAWFQTVTFLQFVPSLLKLLTIGGMMALGSVIILLITLLFGRLYCSTICPLGIFQDVISFVSRKFRRNKFRYKFETPKNKIRYGLLFLVILFMISGSFVLLDLLDPYSIFGRFASDFIRPLYVWGNNLVASILEALDIYAVYRFDLNMVNIFPAVVSALFLFLILWLAITKGRLYCNSICPVGTFLGFISRFSVFRLNMESTSCTQCGKCAWTCKSACIQIKNREIDASRCVGCFNCIQVCNNHAVKYQLAWTHKNIQKKTGDSGKRKFLKKSLLISAGTLGVVQVMDATNPKGKNLKVYKKDHLVNPPGSISIPHFNRNCTACHLCVSACPGGVLQPRFLESGWDGLLQPFMDQTAGYCNYECTRCGEVCPSGAIQPLTKETKKVTQVGVVHFVKDNCVVQTHHTSCGSCSEHCPTQAVKMVPFIGKLTIPQTDQEICIGCGACEHACPVRPFRAIFVEGNVVQKMARKPQIKKAEDEEMEDFPF